MIMAMIIIRPIEVTMVTVGDQGRREPRRARREKFYFPGKFLKLLCHLQKYSSARAPSTEHTTTGPSMTFISFNIIIDTCFVYE